MKLKDFLAVAGENKVYVYAPIRSELGYICDHDCLTEAEFRSKKYMKRKIESIDAGHFFFNVYLEYEGKDNK